MPKTEEGLTPMMVQFRTLKAKHPDAVLLFRCGDFYETYMEDAITAAQVLGITLTQRSNKGKGAAIEMAGFPYHAIDNYLPKLIRSGFRVAICDQLEDPRLAKKLVKRGITELVTPGVALNDNVLQSKENNFLAAVYTDRAMCGLALLDISTGEFDVAEGSVDYIHKLLLNFAPKEILIPRGTKEQFRHSFGGKQFTFELDDWVWNHNNARDRLLQLLGVKTLKGYGVGHLTASISAAGAIVFYLADTQHTQTGHITGLRLIDENSYMKLDAFTMRNLEVLAPMQGDGPCLLSVVDHTTTPMGGRLLRRWLSFPLCDVAQIEARQTMVEYMFRDPECRDTLLTSLRRIGDVERLLSKISTARIGPREMQQLSFALQAMQPLRTACAGAEIDSLKALAADIDPCPELYKRIHATLLPNPPVQASKGGYIASGINEEIDTLRDLSHNSKQYLRQLQQNEAARTGIQSLKIGFNNVYGYYLEVRNTYKDLVPPTWIRKQTLVGAERYITEELKDYEQRILGAEDRILALETQIYSELITFAARFIVPLQKTSRALATIDCLLSHALLAMERRYVRPIVDDTTQLEIIQGRHPVIEAQMKQGEQYIPNDVRLDTNRQQIIIVTGPNMSGKSALLRQTALIVLLAQTGSFVPAGSARIGLVDRIFTRVGASDNLAAGESTFMVEMTEAASIMNNFTTRSLVLFDELGRGTSTYDGISIAWAIVEHLHESPQGHPRTLFATHYHELNDMAKTLTRIHNYNVAVRETDGDVIFLRKLVPGGSEHSFGIHVAQMAGMPPSIVKRAATVLSQLEQAAAANRVGTPTDDIASSRDNIQLNLFSLDDPVLKQIRDRLLTLDVNNLTPLEALNTLNEIKQLLLN